MASDKEVYVIGAGLSGAEAAWFLAQHGIKVIIKEMRPTQTSPAHKTAKAAELVCSNSLRSDDATCSAIGLLHQEMRQIGSLIMQAANATKVPAGGALAVDREGFSAFIDEKLHHHPLITFTTEEITVLPPADQSTIIASGPLTSPALIQAIIAETGGECLNFFDAIAPVVYKDSIDFSQCWYQSRYDKGDKFDYINCPLTEKEYYDFVDALLTAEKTEFHDPLCADLRRAAARRQHPAGSDPRESDQPHDAPDAGEKHAGHHEYRRRPDGRRPSRRAD